MKRAAHPLLRNGLLALIVAGTALPAVALPVSPPPPARRLQLVELVREDCGSCHGSRLTGSLGAPLTPQALQKKPTPMLVETILDGRPGTPMPPWRPFLSRNEATWIVQQLKKGFPHAP